VRGQGGSGTPWRVNSNVLAGRHIAVGVGGGIAAYKACDLVRELGRQGATVRVAMTKAATEFITPLTLQSLSGQVVFTDSFDLTQETHFGHLHLARWADCFVVAPATADLLARVRAGLANDAVTTSLLAFRGPVLLAPAMNTAMWDNARTQDNLRALLAEPRFAVVGPGVGVLADGDVGAGRLADLAELIAATERLFVKGVLAGKKVLVTAGPTREALDPVRFISNPSTGKMGLAMASVARALGAEVTVVLGPCELARDESLEFVDVTTADQMLAAVMERVGAVDYFVAAAAVSDWKPATVATQKVKKTEGPEVVSLVRTPDVLLTAANEVHGRTKRPVLVGFAAETHDLLRYANEKLARKRLDVVVANDVSAPGVGFGAERNAVTLLSREGPVAQAQGTKREVAARVWDFILARPSPAS
jgi:phosphopantothenoylcysteine decarboxylase/phosphopantothenate--cysteine ligase